MMLMFLTGLPDADERNNDTNNCYNNTHNSYDSFYHHILYLSLYFPLCIPPWKWKFSKRTYFGERRTTYRLDSTYVAIIIDEK